MNPWKEVVVTAHHILNLSDQVATPHTPLPLGVRLTGLLQELTFARDIARRAQGDLKLANDQLTRQAKTIADFQSKLEPTSDAPPSPTNDQYNAAVIKEVKRRSTAKKEKREEEGL
jgi:hypothetical protein